MTAERNTGLTCPDVRAVGCVCYQLRHDLTELAFAAGAVLDGASVETEAQRLRLNELAAVLDAIDWPTEPAQIDGSVRHG